MLQDVKKLDDLSLFAHTLLKEIEVKKKELAATETQQPSTDNFSPCGGSFISTTSLIKILNF